jgi:hypothetical protein
VAIVDAASSVPGDRYLTLKQLAYAYLGTADKKTETAISFLKDHMVYGLAKRHIPRLRYTGPPLPYPSVDEFSKKGVRKEDADKIAQSLVKSGFLQEASLATKLGFSFTRALVTDRGHQLLMHAPLIRAFLAAEPGSVQPPMLPASALHLVPFTAKGPTNVSAAEGVDEDIHVTVVPKKSRIRRRDTLNHTMSDVSESEMEPRPAPKKPRTSKTPAAYDEPAETSAAAPQEPARASKIQAMDPTRMRMNAKTGRPMVKAAWDDGDEAQAEDLPPPRCPSKLQQKCQRMIQVEVERALAANAELSGKTEDSIESSAVGKESQDKKPTSFYNTPVRDCIVVLSKYLPTTTDQLKKTPNVPPNVVRSYGRVILRAINQFLSDEEELRMSLSEWPAALCHSVGDSAPEPSAAPAALRLPVRTPSIGTSKVEAAKSDQPTITQALLRTASISATKAALAPKGESPAPLALHTSAGVPVAQKEVRGTLTPWMQRSI